MSVYVERTLLVLAWVLAAAVGISLVLVMHGCHPAPTLTPAQGADLSQYANDLMRCEIEARDAGSFRVFDACAKDAGLK